MARKGRPKNMKADRYPSGGVKHVEPTPVGELARARRNYIRGLRDPLFGTELGMLQLEGRVTAEQRAAGEEWAKIVEDHRRIVMDGSQARPKAGQLEPHIPGNQEHEYSKHLIERTQERYDHAFAAIVDGKDGIAAMRQLNRLVINNETLSYAEREQAKAALTRLGVVLNLTTRPKCA